MTTTKHAPADLSCCGWHHSLGRFGASFRKSRIMSEHVLSSDMGYVSGVNLAQSRLYCRPEMSDHVGVVCGECQPAFLREFPDVVLLGTARPDDICDWCGDE